MLLVVGDEGHYNGRFPWVTSALVVINVVVFVAQVMLGPAFTLAYALVPIELPVHIPRSSEPVIVAPQPIDVRPSKDRPDLGTLVERPTEVAATNTRPAALITLLTYQFLHGDVFHLVGNLLFLLVFGRNVECAMNHVLFLIFYLACGAAAGVAQVVSDPYSLVPCIGASGAISGIMGAYVSIHPFNNVKVWFLFLVFEAPALVVIGIWLILNYVSAMLSLENPAKADNVAYWAHLGGFGAGFVLLRTLILGLQIQRSLSGSRDQPAAPAKTEAADPFATFVTVQAVRKMKEQQQG